MSYIWHAFKTGKNLSFLLIATVVGMVFSPWSIYWLSFLAVEALVLTMFSTNKRFRMGVDAILHNEESVIKLQHQKSTLRMAGSNYYRPLKEVEDMLKQIKKSYLRNSSSGEGATRMLTDSLASLDKLFAEYVRYEYSLLMLQKLSKDKETLNDIKTKIAELETKSKDASDEIQELLAQQIEVLHKRAKNKSGIGEKVKRITAQVDYLRETFKLMRDESATLLDPGMLGSQVDEAQIKLETAKDTILEIESFMNVDSNGFNFNKIR